MKMINEKEEGAHPIIRHDPDGPRYYLADEPLHAGDMLELLTDDGSWVTGRYEYYWDRKNGNLDAYVCVGEETLPIQETATLRFIQNHRFRP
jgi:hypothetical protein